MFSGQKVKSYSNSATEVDLYWLTSAEIDLNFLWFFYLATDACLARYPQAIGVGIKNSGSPIESLHGVSSDANISPADVKVYVLLQYIP